MQEKQTKYRRKNEREQWKQRAKKKGGRCPSKSKPSLHAKRQGEKRAAESIF